MHPQIAELLQGLAARREAAGMTQADLEDRLILGAGWIDLVESGTVEPPLSFLLAILHEIGTDLATLVQGTQLSTAENVLSRPLQAEETGDGLDLAFQFGAYPVSYEIPGATISEFDELLRVMRSELAASTSGAKRAAVKNAFLYATQTWPDVNPSDLWYFIVQRAFADSFNHPASSAGTDFSQSWKRTAGWALEEVFIDHYQPFLNDHGVSLEMPPPERKAQLLAGLGLGNQVNPDKADVLMVGVDGSGNDRCFGVAHVKASFAERRTDDTPLSTALIAKGFVSPLVTMDCKGKPSEVANNPGELGEPFDGAGPDERGAKRLDIERDKQFDACFSYNRNTRPTPPGLPAAARIVVCDFADPDDAFSTHVIAGWERLVGP